MAMKQQQRRRLTSGLLLSPALGIITIFTLIPIILTGWISLHSWSMYTPLSEMPWRGLDNYATVLSSPVHLQAFTNTLIYAGVSVVVLVPLAFLVASLLYFPKLRGSAVLRVILFATYVLPTAAVALVWGSLYAPYGPLGLVFDLFGAQPPALLTTPNTALISLVVMNVWQTLGYYVILMTAGLTQIPEELYEAARVDGAGPIRQMFSITIPMCRNTLFFILLISAVNAIQVFDPVYLLTQGGPMNSTNVISYSIQKTAFSHGLAGQASAMAFMLFLVICLVGLSIGGVVRWRGRQSNG